ncbi:Os04g0272700 [Oryza sativa Japonica Group]|uniref:Os04g0272700 protein n=1 Tax=Oryza sativa subsp. japonica TaxID=39947 RepID=A0A0P0W8C5_ORYSJ|nr:hypothetical protein EE612_022729 [Oryza sativa]BAS88336.1 Os04g0272700 [Oryza sativa Japonica Group]
MSVLGQRRPSAAPLAPWSSSPHGSLRLSAPLARIRRRRLDSTVSPPFSRADPTGGVDPVASPTVTTTMGGRYLHRSICQRRTSLIRRQPQPLPPSILREGFIFAK